MRSRIILQWLAGTLGGFIGWCLVEPIPWLTTDPKPGQADIPTTWLQTLVFGLIIGATVSGCIGAAYGSGSSARRKRYALLGVLLGAAGGALGLIVGQFIFQTLQGPSTQMSENRFIAPLGFMGQILARSLGWAGIGLGLGLLQGGINGSAQRSRNGAVGGALGGLLGGLIFALMSATVDSTTDSTGRSPFFFLTGEMMRCIGLTVTGSAIGLFVGLTERLLRNAWVRVRVGRNEGQEFLIEKSPTVIGRDELSDIPLFGDIAVAKHHAQIVGSHGTFALQALETGVYLNGAPVQSAPLTEGDVIRIGSREVEFHQKGAPRIVDVKDIVKPALAPKPATPEGVCEFCGVRKDPSGNCACSPATAPPPPQPVVTQALRLLGLSGPYLGRSFPLTTPISTLGRGADRDISLPDDTSVSRIHARIVAGASGIEVLDEGSSNGTFLNDQPVQRAVVKAGDLIRFGNSVFRLESV